MVRKIFLCLFMIMVLGITGCSLSLSETNARNMEYAELICDIETDKIRVSEEGLYCGYFDLKEMQLYNRDENIIAYIEYTQDLRVETNYWYEIYIEDEFRYIFKRNKDPFSKNSYEISNEKSEFLAYISNENSIIEIKDNDENLIAECEISNTNQYVIKIYRYNIEKKVIFMIISSYYNNILL